MSEALLGMDSMSMTTLIAIGAGIVIVLGLIFWAFRRRGKSPFVRGSASRQPRLAVLDAAQVDDRRRLILIRRDHVEHLVMIGGPSDIVVERGINRAAVRGAQEAASAPATGAQQPPQRPPKRAERAPRPQPVADEPAIAKQEPVGMPANEASQVASIAGGNIAASAINAEEPPVPVPDPVPVPEPVKAPELPEEKISEAPPAEKQRPPEPVIAAASVSSATVSEADQKAALESPEQVDEPSMPAELPDEVAPAPNVQLEASVVELANTPTTEKAAVELDEIFDATNDVESTVSENRPEPAVDIPPPDNDSADREPNLSDVSEALADVATGDTEETVMSAEELIADFDDLLEAEISRTKQQQPDMPNPGPDADNVTPLQKQSLEDEMKKLLGDLNVKP